VRMPPRSRFAQDFLQDKAREGVRRTPVYRNRPNRRYTRRIAECRCQNDRYEVEALSNARDKMVWTIAAVSLLGVVTFIGLGIYLARRLTDQLGWIIAEMSALSAGDLDSQLAAAAILTRSAQWARALEVFRFEMIASRQMAAELRRSQEHLAHAQRIAHMGVTSQTCALTRPNGRMNSTIFSELCAKPMAHQPITFLRNGPPGRSRIGFYQPEKKSRRHMSGPFEYRLRPDGSVRHIYRENGFIRNEAGNPFFLIGNVSGYQRIRAAQEREKELERQLMHSQSWRALGTLAGGVAHDLNNTLVRSWHCRSGAGGTSEEARCAETSKPSSAPASGPAISSRRSRLSRKQDSSGRRSISRR